MTRRRLRFHDKCRNQGQEWLESFFNSLQVTIRLNRQRRPDRTVPYTIPNPLEHVWTPPCCSFVAACCNCAYIGGARLRASFWGEAPRWKAMICPTKAYMPRGTYSLWDWRIFMYVCPNRKRDKRNGVDKTKKHFSGASYVTPLHQDSHCSLFLT